MKTRIITAIILLAIAIPILCLSDYIVYPIAVSIMAMIATFELMRISSFRKKIFIALPSYLIAGALPIIAYFCGNAAVEFLLSSLTVLFAFLLYLIAYGVFKRGKVKLSDIATHFMFFSYIVIAFTSLSVLRYINNGVFYYMLILLASWMCDSCAYFVGRAIGKHKLIPEISPKKTVEGAVGGVFFATVSFMIYGIVLSYIEGAPNPNYVVLAILGFVLSIISQIGDLSLSLLKREKGIKDFGTIFPGHGGVLDRFDSVLPVAPVLLAVCMIIPPLA